MFCLAVSDVTASIRGRDKTALSWKMISIISQTMPIIFATFKQVRGVINSILLTFLKAAGYYGNDPIGDGYLVLLQDGTRVTLRFDRDGHGVTYNDVYMGKLADVNVVDFSTLHNLVFDRNISPPQNMTGTSGEDDITGSQWGGTIWGLDGNDDITVNSGDTTIIGGAGQDTISLGSDRDTVVFESDLDNIAGNSDYILNFETGIEGDRVDITNLLLAMGYYGDEPIADGYLELRQSGIDLSSFRGC